MSPSELVQRHISNIAKKVEEQDLTIYAEHLVTEFPTAPDGHTAKLEGPGALAKFLANIGNFAPERYPDQVEVFDAGENIIGLFRSNFKVTETGRFCSMPMILIFQLQDGRVVRLREYYDPLKVLKAFGELPED